MYGELVNLISKALNSTAATQKLDFCHRVYMFLYTHIHICVYICTYVRTYVFMYICMYLRTYVDVLNDHTRNGEREIITRYKCSSRNSKLLHGGEGSHSTRSECIRKIGVPPTTTRGVRSVSVLAPVVRGIKLRRPLFSHLISYHSNNTYSHTTPCHPFPYISSVAFKNLWMTPNSKINCFFVFKDLII